MIHPSTFQANHSGDESFSLQITFLFKVSAFIDRDLKFEIHIYLIDEFVSVNLDKNLVWFPINEMG